MSEEVNSLPCDQSDPVGENNSDSIEKPTTKTKRPYKWTEARKQAFERCRKARSEQVKGIRKKKVIDAGLVSVEPDPEPQKEQVKAEPEQSDLRPLIASPQGRSPSTSQEVQKPHKQKSKPKRKVVVYQSESSSESSESDIEIEIKRKPRQKRTYSPEPRTPVPANPYQQILTWL